jgi:hypothetical protein
VRALRSADADVLLVAFGDPARRSTLMGRVRERIRAYNSAVESIAEHYGCYLIRFWDVAAMDDDELWDEDRLHLSPAGHRLAAASALEALGLGDDSWRTPAVPGPRPTPMSRGAGNLRWVRAHLAPWVGRRMRGQSSGDGVRAKDPDWVTVSG